jgi:hypothetical protein
MMRSRDSQAHITLQIDFVDRLLIFVRIRSLGSPTHLALQKFIEVYFDEQSFCPHRLEA